MVYLGDSYLVIIGIPLQVRFAKANNRRSPRFAGRHRGMCVGYKDLARLVPRAGEPEGGLKVKV